jgi:hypothetical protein
MKVLFLDESGDHNLSVIDPLYPVFVLGGVIMDVDYAKTEVAAALDRFKTKMFGTTDIVLHTADIARNRAGFERLKDKAFRETFYAEMNALMAGLDYQVVACVVHKDVHLQRYGFAAVDPYMLSLDILVERFCHDIGRVPGGGVIIAEMRGSTLDRGIELAWLNLKIQGTRFMQAVDIEQRVRGLYLRDKKANIAGLQLADLVVSPIGRHVLGKPDKADWAIVESKLRRSPSGRTDGFGLVVLPKN